MAILTMTTCPECDLRTTYSASEKTCKQCGATMAPYPLQKKKATPKKKKKAVVETPAPVVDTPEE